MNTTIHLNPTVVIAVLLAAWGIYRTSTTVHSETTQIERTVGPTIYSMGFLLFGFVKFQPLNTLSLMTLVFAGIGVAGLYCGAYCVSRSRDTLAIHTQNSTFLHHFRS